MVKVVVAVKRADILDDAQLLTTSGHEGRIKLRELSELVIEAVAGPAANDRPASATAESETIGVGLNPKAHVQTLRSRRIIHDEMEFVT